MADLDSAFREYYPPAEEQRRTVMTKGLVCLDTNVLLDAYRFAPQAREELLNVLEKLGGRLWIPYQVAFEFHKNRISVIGDQAKAYISVLDAIEGITEYFKENVSDKIRTLGRTVALTQEEQQRILELIPESIFVAWQAIDDLKTQHGISLDMISEDPVLKRLEGLLKGKVGERPTPEAEQRAREEAKRRAAENIPPGFADQKNKADSSGDYLVWSQVLEEAKSRKMPILFVTRDTKDDWFRKEKGRTISARPELIREAREITGNDLVIMETRSFLFHSREYLDATVSDELLSQVEKLPEVESRPEFEDVASITTSAHRALLKACDLLQDRLKDEGAVIQEWIDSLIETQSDAELTYEEKSELVEKLSELYARSRDVLDRTSELNDVRISLLEPISRNSNSLVFHRDILATIINVLGPVQNRGSHLTLLDGRISIPKGGIGIKLR
ncbi:hypothetical protein GCM10009555_012460 [Acrocarpospora macrocephala]|uniref:PIN like domain-containing protein n=1 Tax=Acrocarpospora macrocephala TaxID=150177 RepID=A0A5M3XAD0_9ACTN|nr:PIN domain-containing protein [Acrocarpospora macrocephala]GES16461.1 hypothetical protein Amac_100590 [Acrocarpospora macrocephala]